MATVTELESKIAESEKSANDARKLLEAEKTAERERAAKQRKATIQRVRSREAPKQLKACTELRQLAAAFFAKYDEFMAIKPTADRDCGGDDSGLPAVGFDFVAVGRCRKEFEQRGVVVADLLAAFVKSL